MSLGNRLIWQGAKVTVYEDGSFGMTPFDASMLEDHTLPPPEEIEIELPTIDPNGIYTAEEILQMQKELNATIKEQKKKLYDHLREDGTVQVSKVVEALKEIFDKLGEQGKN